MLRGLRELFRDPVSGLRRPTCTVGLGLGLLLMVVDLGLAGRLLVWDLAVRDLYAEQRWPALLPVADVLDRIGQRLICLPVLFAVAWVLARRARTPRPLLLALGGNLVLNLVVGVLKLATGRPSPIHGGPAPLFMFGHYIEFPSGHTANVVFVYGLTVVLLIRYGSPGRWARRLLLAAVPALTVLMTLVSLYRQTHWLTDLVAGAMVGAMVLEMVVVVDRPWPRLSALLAPRVVGLVRLVVPGWSRPGRVRPGPAPAIVRTEGPARDREPSVPRS